MRPTIEVPGTLRGLNEPWRQWWRMVEQALSSEQSELSKTDFERAIHRLTGQGFWDFRSRR